VIREEGCPEYEIRQYIAEAAQGLAYLQLKELVHGDVKSENLLLDKDRKIKLVGYSLNLDTTSLESLYYKSPEVCKGEPCTDKSDVWSLGCVAYELCSSRV
jgi:serine/threonine protein kinase